MASDAHFSMERREAANVAISSAMATLNMVLYEPDIRSALVGVPLFTHTMVAFSAVFLLKVAWMWSSAPLNIDQRQVLSLVQSVIDILSGVQASDKHLTYHIANGLKKMLAKLRTRDLSPSGQANSVVNEMGMVQNSGMGQQSMGDSLNAFGLDFPDTWNDFPTSLDFFPISNR
jgi:hypothetical protein